MWGGKSKSSEMVGFSCFPTDSYCICMCIAHSGIYLFFEWLKTYIRRVVCNRKNRQVTSVICKREKIITTTTRFQKPERSQGPVVCVYGGHLQRCEKILAVQSPGGRDRRRASRPESEER